LEVEPLILVGLATILVALGIEAERQIALAVDPYLMPRGILAERRIQRLLRRIPALRVPRISALFEYAEGRDVGRKGVFGQQGELEQAIEQPAMVIVPTFLLTAILSDLIVDIGIFDRRSVGYRRIFLIGRQGKSGLQHNREFV
jgi:hypothetical protein